MWPAFPLHLSFGELLACLIGAWLWDRFLGEPPAVIHPVVWMGRLVSWLTRLRPRRNPGAELAFGAAVALAGPALFALAAALVLVGLADAPVLRFCVSVWLLKSSFALNALVEAAEVVRRALAAGDLGAARAGLASLCSRDPRGLDQQALAAGAVESVAENASDSVIAPLFFYLLFGLPGALAYRAINTADAMIGYRGEYEYFGKAAARLDDLVNLVPARLTALGFLFAGLVHGLPARAGLAVLLRDGGKTASPNAGRPMAAMAGLLGVRLEKAGAYALGDADGPVTDSTIARAVRLLRTLGWIALLAAAQGLAWAVGA